MPGYVPDTPTQLRESGGTTLALGSCLDGGALVVSGSTVIGTVGAFNYGTTSTALLGLRNTTDATSGSTVQYSPALQLSGAGWSTAAAGSSLMHHMRQELRPVSAATSTCALHWLFATDSGGYTSRMSISSSGLLSTSILTVSSYISADGGNLALNATNYASGFGVCSTLASSSATYPLLLDHVGRTDGANNVVVAACYDRNAALITNGATMYNALVSWTDSDSDTNRRMISGYYDGALWLAAGNSTGVAAAATTGVHYGAGLTIKNFSELVTIDADASTSTTAQIPASAVVLAVTCRVVTVIPTAATFTIGIAAAPDRYGTGISTAATTTAVSACAPAAHAAAESIVITPNASPADNTGRVRVTCTYFVPTAPTS